MAGSFGSAGDGTVFCSAAGVFFATAVSGGTLRRLFGAFLIGLAFFTFSEALKGKNS
ncbi:MAG: hypothetical protein IJ317_06150 [Clostridia bacterium]|nr:hypothetical protein [Clostridia bacterium]